MKKLILALITVVLAGTMLFTMVACSGGSASIINISREDGSGTKGAFEEIIGIDEGDVVVSKQVYSSTNTVITNVSKNANAMGYISLGSLNDSVKALQVGGVDATTANIVSGSYTLARPFNITTKKGVELSPQASEFLVFIVSSEAQAIINDNGFVSIVSNADSYEVGQSVSGSLKISGSTSVEKLMQKLVDKFITYHSGVTLELIANGSSTGVKETINGLNEIGMASRDLKDSEKSQVNGTVLCKDGIAVIVNKGNDRINDITLETLKNIYTGTITKFDEITSVE